MTDRQLRALRRKHLLLIIRDLEKDLQKALEDKEQLLQAYECGKQSQSQSRDQGQGQNIDSGRRDQPQAGPQWPEWQQQNSGWPEWQQQSLGWPEWQQYGTGYAQGYGAAEIRPQDVGMPQWM